MLSQHAKNKAPGAGERGNTDFGAQRHEHWDQIALQVLGPVQRQVAPNGGCRPHMTPCNKVDLPIAAQLATTRIILSQ